MTQSDNLYRRSSGIYVLRITVPARHRVHFAQREIHVSTRSSNRADARIFASAILRRWHQCIRELAVDEKRIGEARMALAGKVVVAVSELCDVTGLAVADVLKDVIRNKIPYWCLASSWAGFLVSDLSLVEREPPGIGGFVLDSAFEEGVGVPYTFNSYLQPYGRPPFAHGLPLQRILADGFTEESSFFVPQRPGVAAFFDLPGVRLDASLILISKMQAERVFITPKAIALSAISGSAGLAMGNGPAPIPVRYACCEPERAGEPVSSLLPKILEKKANSWKLEQQKSIAMHYQTFVELMGDPTLGQLNRELMWEYERRLRLIPARKDRAKRRHGFSDLQTLSELAREHGEDLLTDSSVERYVDSVAAVFAWGVNNMILTFNPAKDLIEKAPDMVRAQDQRDAFGDVELHKIFSADWFRSGRGERTKSGVFHGFSPHYYWLPLIGLYTGARLNEICQLHLADIVKLESGGYYFDLSLFVEAEQSGKYSANKDKSLKNSNSIRLIPVHHKLVSLGLIEYVVALRQLDYSHLFPELRRDKVKGYGKAAGIWFNERFLGKGLGIPRGGKLSFHSFRHTFITKLDRLETPGSIAERLVGHTAGTSETRKRYVKDRLAGELQIYVDAVDFELPAIEKFDVEAGLEAVRHALARKANRARELKNIL